MFFLFKFNLRHHPKPLGWVGVRCLGQSPEKNCFLGGFPEMQLPHLTRCNSLSHSFPRFCISDITSIVCDFPTLTFWAEASHLDGRKDYNFNSNIHRVFWNCILLNFRFNVCKKTCLNWRKRTICHLNLGDDTVHTYLHGTALPLEWILNFCRKYFPEIFLRENISLKYFPTESTVHAVGCAARFVAVAAVFPCEGICPDFLPRRGIWPCLGGNRRHRQPCGLAA